jgi:hypothetical protein
LPVAGLMADPLNTCAPYGSVNPVAKSVLEAVEVACANALTNPKQTTRAVKVQLRESFRMGSNLNERLRFVVVVCSKLLMGVPWHAFPPEVSL